MTTRHAQATWGGSLKQGSGRMQTGSGAFQGDYSFGSRFENSQGTNPEELLGAAHAGCFSMALAAQLEKAGFKPKKITTSAEVQVEQNKEGFEITKVQLTTQGQVPDIDAEEFKNHAGQAAKQCVVSKALTGARVEVQAELGA